MKDQLMFRCDPEVRERVRQLCDRLQAKQIGRITMSDVLRDLVLTELERRLDERMREERRLEEQVREADQRGR